MSYLDIGFNQFLQKDTDFYPDRRNIKETEQLVSQIESSKVLPTGLLASKDKNVVYNMASSRFVVSDGARTRFEAGLLDDGSYGMRAWDHNGNIVINISGTNTKVG